MNKQLLKIILTLVVLFYINPVAATDVGKWETTGGMNEARAGHSAVLLTNGKVLVAGGANSQNQVINTAEIYDPSTGKWQITGSMSHKRGAFAMSVLPDGKVLAVGGTSDKNFSETSAEIYDPETEVWTETASTSTGRRAAVSLLLTQGALAGKTIVAGGDLGDWGGHTITKKVELYDPTTGTWSPTSDMVSYRYSGGLLMLPDNSLFMVGGIDCCGYTWLNKAETFNQNTETWTALNNKTTFAQERAVLLPNQQVLVAGGAKGSQGSSRSVPDAELFNPSTKVWTKTASMSVARDSYTLTLLNNGQVLAVGGNNGGWGICHDASPNAELYDYQTGKWTATDAMNTSRISHSATVLLNGRVLIAGGGNCNGAKHASAELYTPATSAIAPKFLTIKDLDGDNTPELAVIQYDQALQKTIITIKNAKTGALVQQLNFSSAFVPKKIMFLPDQNANGRKELALLGERSNDNAQQIEVHDGLNGKQLGRIELTEKAIDWGRIANVDGSGKTALAVLQSTSTATRVKLYDVSSGNEIRALEFTATNASELAVLSHRNKAQIAVLSKNKDTKTATIEIRNAQTSKLIRNLSYANNKVRGLFTLPDIDDNGNKEFALRTDNGLILLDTKTGLLVKTLNFDLNKPVKVARIGYDYLVLLGTRKSDGQTVAQVSDLRTAKLVSEVTYVQTDATVGFAVLSDFNANGMAELARITMQGGKWFAEVRDSLTGELISEIVF